MYYANNNDDINTD